MRALITILLLSMTPAAASPAETGLEPLMDFVCSARGLHCEHLRAPEVLLFAENSGRMGMYDPTIAPGHVMVNLLWLQAESQERMTTVVLHEVSHYVDTQLGILDWSLSGDEWIRAVCESEATAFAVGNAWIIYQGYEIEGDYTWIERYPHCLN